MKDLIDKEIDCSASRIQARFIYFTFIYATAIAISFSAGTLVRAYNINRTENSILHGRSKNKSCYLPLEERLNLVRHKVKKDAERAMAFDQVPSLSDLVSVSHGSILKRAAVGKGLPVRRIYHESTSHCENENFSKFLEPLIHPSMLSLGIEPKNIAMFIESDRGFSELRTAPKSLRPNFACAAAKEVLKHRSVEYVALFEYGYDSSDQILEQNSTELFGNFDERVQIYTFCEEESCESMYIKDTNETNDIEKNEYHHEAYTEEEEYEIFDVIVLVDAFSFLLYQSFGVQNSAKVERKRRFNLVYDTFAEDGLLVMGLGSLSAAEFWKKYDGLIEFLNEYGFHVTHVYEESNCGFLVISNNNAYKSRWFQGVLGTDVLVHKRLVRTPDRKSPLKYFDGISMAHYQIPHKIWENSFCAEGSTHHFECKSMRGIGSHINNIPANMFEIKMSTLGKAVGRGVFAKALIPKDSLIMQEQNKDSVHFPLVSLYTIEKLYSIREAMNQYNELRYYYDGYGYAGASVASHEVFVDSGISTFTNHGCNGAVNIGTRGLGQEITLEDHADLREDFASNLDAWDVMKKFSGSSSAYNPVYNRHIFFKSTSLIYSLREIQAGEELFSNYILYGSTDQKYWEGNAKELVSQCSGNEVGVVVQVDSNL